VGVGFTGVRQYSQALSRPFRTDILKVAQHTFEVPSLRRFLPVSLRRGPARCVIRHNRAYPSN